MSVRHLKMKYLMFLLVALTELTVKICGINVIVFMPGTWDFERKVLNRLTQELAMRNYGTASFKGVIIPEKRWLVKQKLHMVRELSLKTGVPEEVYGPLKEIGNEIPWRKDYDVSDYAVAYWRAYTNSCEVLLNSDIMDRMKEDKYDVAVVYSGNPCHMALVYAVNMPFIYFDLTGFSDETVFASGVPSLPSYMPSSNSQFPQKMTLIERWTNLWLYAKEYAAFTEVPLIGKLLNDRYREMDYPITELFRNDYELKKIHPYFPDVNAIKKDAAMYFVNSDSVLEFPGRPTMPNVVYVGGSHIEYPKPLFDPYNETNAKAKDGIIVCSMGTTANASAMSAEMRIAFLGAFSRFPRNVVYFRVDTVDVPGIDPTDLPKNVNFSLFLPQNDLLADKKARLLITNGGINSIMEAIQYGVPVLGIPLYGPNYNNLRKVEAKGFGILLDKKELSSDSIYNAIKELLHNPKYRTAAKSISRAFKDRPMTPFETAMYWVEYTGRNHGAPHLKPAANQMYLFQYLLLDVFCVIILSSYLMAKFFKWGLYIIFQRNTTAEQPNRNMQQQDQAANGHTIKDKCEMEKKLKQDKSLKKRKHAEKEN